MRFKRHTGSSLIEVMLAAAVVSIAVIGGISYRYYSSLDARRANIHATTARVALMLCESWRGIQGDQTYDPIANLGSVMTITASEGPANPEDHTLLGSYRIVLDNNIEDDDYNITYYATLSWKDVQVGLRALNVVVSWAQRDLGSGDFASTDKTFPLTIYALTL